MEKLPQELVDHLVSFLPEATPGFLSSPEKTLKHFPACATLSRRFQKAIESHTFKTLTISSHDHKLREFKAILDPLRRSYLRRLYYNVVLPRCKSPFCQRFKEPAEQEANNEAFTLAMNQLFGVLQTKDHTKDMTRFINDIASPTDGEVKALGYRRYQQSRIRLMVDPEKLQLLPKVSRLMLGLTEHPLLPRVCIDIATRLPDLKSIDMIIEAREMVYPGLSRHDRHTLAEAITEHSGVFKKLTNVLIILEQGSGPCHQLLQMPNLLYPLQHDPLAVAFRRWSSNLESFALEGTFDGTLFWPHDSESPERRGESPERAKLKQLHVKLERHTPSGWWYFMPEGVPNFGNDVRDPEDDPEDFPPTKEEDILWAPDATGVPGLFAPGHPLYPEYESAWDDTVNEVPVPLDWRRTVPNDETMEPLVESWAKALQHMPALEGATLGFNVELPLGVAAGGDEGEEMPTMVEWQIGYQAPGAGKGRWLTNLGSAEKESRRIIFRNTRGWRPCEATMDLLQEVGRRSHKNTDVVVLSLDEQENVSLE